MPVTSYLTFDREIVSENRDGVKSDDIPDSLGNTVRIFEPGQADIKGIFGQGKGHLHAGEPPVDCYWVYDVSFTGRHGPARPGTLSYWPVSKPFFGMFAYYEDVANESELRSCQASPSGICPVADPRHLWRSVHGYAYTLPGDWSGDNYGPKLGCYNTCMAQP